MRTTIDLPDALLRRLKARAALQGREVRDLLAEYVEQGLERSERAPEPAQGARDAGPRRRSDPPLFVREAAPGAPLPFRTNAELEELLLEEEFERVRGSWV